MLSMALKLNKQQYWQTVSCFFFKLPVQLIKHGSLVSIRAPHSTPTHHTNITLNL